MQENALSRETTTILSTTSSTSNVCRDCQSADLDADLYRYYRVSVCRACRDAQPERYTLLTKTEVKEDYLLTDEELRDAARVPFWERPNPHKRTYAHMKLFLREQVEQFAFEKWGGAEGYSSNFV
jgi:DNA-repair protein complementing XP-A cells